MRISRDPVHNFVILGFFLGTAFGFVLGTRGLTGKSFRLSPLFESTGSLRVDSWSEAFIRVDQEVECFSFHADKIIKLHRQIEGHGEVDTYIECWPYAHQLNSCKSETGWKPNNWDFQ